MKKLHTTKKDAVRDMIAGLEEYAKKRGVSLEGQIPDDVNRLDDVFNDGGVGRCEHFTDLALEYAIQFGTLEDYGDMHGAMAHQWTCIEMALRKLQEKYNK